MSRTTRLVRWSTRCTTVHSGNTGFHLSDLHRHIGKQSSMHLNHAPSILPFLNTYCDGCTLSQCPPLSPSLSYEYLLASSVCHQIFVCHQRLTGLALHLSGDITRKDECYGLQFHGRCRWRWRGQKDAKQAKTWPRIEGLGQLSS